MKTNKKKGFTLVELVIVIAVIAILAAVLIPTFTVVIKNANNSAAMQNAKSAQTAYATCLTSLDNIPDDANEIIIISGDHLYLGTNGSLVELQTKVGEKSIAPSATAFLNTDLVALNAAKDTDAVAAVNRFKKTTGITGGTAGAVIEFKKINSSSETWKDVGNKVTVYALSTLPVETADWAASDTLSFKITAVA